MSKHFQIIHAARTMQSFRRKLSFAAVLLSAIFLTTNAASAAPVDFSLRSLDGATVSNSSVQGKVAVFVFGATWLPLSRTQTQGVQKLANKYGSRGVEVFWVSTDSDSSKSKNFASDDALRAFANKQNLKVTVLRDPDGALSKRAFNVNQVPSIVILDRRGNIVSTLNGYDNGELDVQLGAQLDKIL